MSTDKKNGAYTAPRPLPRKKNSRSLLDGKDASNENPSMLRANGQSPAPNQRVFHWIRPRSRLAVAASGRETVQKASPTKPQHTGAYIKQPFFLEEKAVTGDGETPWAPSRAATHQTR